MDKGIRTFCQFLMVTFSFGFKISSTFANHESILDNFQYEIQNLSKSEQKLLQKYTRNEGCRISLAKLSHITVTYWGFDNTPHAGTLIMNKKIAHEVVAIFHELYQQKFPIEKMEPMYYFEGNDNAAMAANNTSSFNCQGYFTKDRYRLRSYGYAININSLLNPSVKGRKVFPPDGKAYLNRSKPIPGMILRDDLVYQAFIKRGWTWGGSWTDQQDYHYFAKNCITHSCRS